MSALPASGELFSSGVHLLSDKIHLLVFQLRSKMKNKLNSFFAILLAALILGSFSAARAQQTRKPLPPAPNPLVSSLPASDAVISFNAQKFLNVALPQLLGADSPKMAQINAHIDQIREQTGLDLRQFEFAALGLKYRQVSAAEIDFEPVILVNGKLNAGAIMAMVKIAASGKFREEQVGGKTVYVLQMKEIFAAEAQKQPGSSTVDKTMEKIFKTFSGELAVGALNDKTLAVGTLARMRETFAGASPLSQEMRSLVTVKPGAILSFGGNVPQGISKMFGLDNEEVAKMMDSIKLVSGYMNISAAGNASLMFAAKTGTVEEAANLEDTMNGFKELGKMLVGSAKGNEKLIYMRMIDNARITRIGSQVQLNLLVPQSDLSVLAKKL
jgi:hypothetical protein